MAIGHDHSMRCARLGSDQDERCRKEDDAYTKHRPNSISQIALAQVDYPIVQRRNGGKLIRVDGQNEDEISSIDKLRKLALACRNASKKDCAEYRPSQLAFLLRRRGHA